MPGESMSTVTPMRRADARPQHRDAHRAGPDRRGAVLAVQVRAALDQQHAAVVAEDVALHLAADEARRRADDLGLQRAGEGRALGQRQAAIAEQAGSGARRGRALQLSPEQATPDGGCRCAEPPRGHSNGGHPEGGVAGDAPVAAAVLRVSVSIRPCNWRW